jgi:hypothetical protein
VYTKLVRYSPEPLLQAFDAPDGFVSTPLRDTTTTATQALQLLNGSWALARAEALATRLLPEPDGKNVVERVYHLVLGRRPEPRESAAALRFLRDQPSRLAATGRPAREQAAIDLCHVLLNSNELIYLD